MYFLRTKQSAQSIKLFFLIGIVLLCLGIGFKAEAFPPEYVYFATYSGTAGAPALISVVSEHSVGGMASWCVTMDFGDGSPTQFSSCTPAGMDISCKTNFSHTYSSEGVYVTTAISCNCARPTDCVQKTQRFPVGPPTTPPVCGNAMIESGERCDDGNVISGDGCNSNCQIEGGPVATPAPQDEINPLKYFKFGDLLDKIIDVAFWIAIIILPIGIIVGGFMFLSAAGNPSNIELGKKIILYCAVMLGTIIMIKTLSFMFKDDLTFTK
ncbi:DUF4215 domain-containing protein [Patescibacteria group bacterium]|nr:DUF4215 domain-containing protein [Patescibacteria group bacterium]MBU4023333.1 DUF4215 domain-containing protein [Patescibacteria group bacterium]